MNKNQPQTDFEVRVLAHDTDETRARVVNEETRTIKGYGIVFDRESVDLRAGGRVFREVIRREATNGVDFSKVLSMHNHDRNRLIGNARAGTLRTGVDSVGVWYEVDLPKSPTGDDVLETVRRGDTQGSSFQFTVAENGDAWSVRSGRTMREITAFGEVFEMGPVSDPAYPDTSISARAIEAAQAIEEAEAKENEAIEPENTFMLNTDAMEFEQLSLL